MNKPRSFLLSQLFFLIFFSCSLFANELIDVVYTWVDGSDPHWLSLFTQYAEKESGAISSGATAKKRFKDHDELKYSLRSIYQFAPWVNHIYIVTFGQKPEWLIETPMISIVDHHDIFSHPEDLPTFNSMAIECNLHHIPGLQEHYLYFNDDVFLGAPTSPHDFFSPSNKMKIFLSKRAISLSPPTEGEEGFYAAAKNTRALLDSTYGPETRYMHAHTPYPSLKSVVSKVEEQFPEIFRLVSSHRFRSLNDYTITNGLIPYVALYTGHGEAISNQWFTVSFGKDPWRDRKTFRKVLLSHPRFFCLQDGSDEDNPLSLLLLDSFFSEYFPEPAPWESKQKVRYGKEEKE
jgi:hypothetical protein